MRTLASCIIVPCLCKKKKKKDENTWLRNLWLRAQGDFNITWIVTGPKTLGITAHWAVINYNCAVI